MKNEKYIFLAIIVAAMLAVGLFAVNRDKPRDLTSNIGESGVNLSGPTSEEKQAGDDQKQKNEVLQSKQGTAPSNTTAKVVKPVITSSGQFDSPQYGSAIEVRTLITGVYESGGTCTAVFTLGDKVILRQVEALQDATTTRCDVVYIQRNEFPVPGTWDLVVEYKSNTSNGKSDITKVEVN